MNKDWIRKIIYIWSIVVASVLLPTLSSAQVVVQKNIDTPNLSFELGNFTNWKRYYAYFGPVNFLAPTNENINIFTNSPNAKEVENREIWTEKTNDNPIWHENRSGDGKKDISGTFKVTYSWEKEPNLVASCSDYNLPVVPEGYTNAARIGNFDDREMVYDTKGSGKWYSRAMAEKLEYTFTVTENSTLLSYQFAGVLDEPASGNVGSHFGDEHPTMSVKVSAKKNGNAIILPCNSYSANANAGDENLITVKSGCYTKNYGIVDNMLYKEWAMIAYDLRDYIGTTITIEAIVHDCLLELYVCNSCNQYVSGSATDMGNGTFEARCSCGKKKVTKRVMAGGHIGYGYITAETQPLKLITENCPDDDYVTITAPTGFVDYEWKTSSGVSLETEPNSPHVAKVRRSEIQDVDYICNMYGDDRECSHITASVRLAKDPIVMDFSSDATCFNEVSFKDLSYITPLKQSDGTTIIPDTIKSWEWSYKENKNGNYSNNSVKLSDLKDFSHLFEWTAENQGKYEITLKITTANGCTDEIKKEIKVLPRPNIELDGALNVCKGNGTTLTVTNLSDPNNKYTWYKGDVKTQEGPENSFTIDVAENAKYKVVIQRKEDQADCLYEKEFEIKTIDNPIISTFAQNSFVKDNLTQVDICEDNIVDLHVKNETPNLDLTYAWSNLNTEEKNTVGPADTTIYNVVATTKDGCKANSSIRVNVKKKPHLNIEGPDELCVDEEGTFKATSNEKISSYTWDINKGNGTEYKISYNSATSASTQHHISLNGVGKNGCSSTFNKEVIVRNNPALNIPEIKPICEGDYVTINVYGADSCRWGNSEKKEKMPYVWNEIPKEKSYTITGYTRYNSGLECSSTETIEININKVPEIKFEGTTDICKGGIVNLTAKDTADYTNSYQKPTKYEYSWNDPNNTKTANMTAEPTSSTIYTVTVKNGNCAVTENVNITVHNDPIFSVRPTQQRVCIGALDTLVASGEPIKYTWYEGKTANGNQITSTDNGVNDSLYVTINNDITYTVVGENQYGCKTTLNTNVYVKPEPTLSYAGKTHICEGTQVTITPGGADTYYWEWEKNGKDTVSNSVVLKDFPEGTGQVNYTLVGIKDGCKAEKPVSVTIQSSPKIKITGNFEICRDSNTTLTAEPNGNYKITNYTWVGLNSNKDNVVVSPISNQTYEVIGYDEAGCPGRASQEIIVNENPTIEIIGENTLCAGDLITLKATGGTAGNYEWSVTPKAEMSDSTENSIKLVLNKTTTITVTGKNAAGCPSKGTKVVTVYQKPNLTFNAKDICRGEMVDITVDGAATYVWNDDPSKTSTRFTDSNVPNNAITYTAKVTGTENNCSTTKEITININERPDIKIAGPLSYCEGDLIDLKAEGGVSNRYRWSTGETSETLTMTAKSTLTSLTLTGESEEGCTNEETVLLDIKSLPTIRIKEPDSKEVCIGTEIELTAEGGTTYEWENRTLNTPISDCSNKCEQIKQKIDQTTKFVVEGTYSHELATGKLDCKSSAEITIVAKPIPTVTISGDNKICPKTAANLTAVNTNQDAIISKWEWYKINSDNSVEKLSEKKSFINTGELEEDATYIATATSNSNCVGKDTATIQMYDTVVVSIEAQDYICEGSTVNLTAVTSTNGNNYVYNWSPQGAKQEQTGDIALTETTTFNLSITDDNNCISNAEPKTVELIKLPKISISQTPNSQICAGENSVKLSITSNKDVNDMDYYKWYRINDAEINDENGTAIKTAEITFNDLTATTTVKAIGVDKYGCQSEKEIHVIEIQDAPDLTITGVTKACKGDIVQLTASSSKSANIYWENNEIAEGPRSVSLNSVGTVEFKASIEVNGCTTTKTHSIEVFDIPTVKIASDNGKNYVCEGNSLNLTAETTSQDISTIKWNISASETNKATITPTSSPTTCSVTITNGAGCSATNSFDIEIKSNPIIYINDETNGEDAVCIGDNFELKASGNDTQNYSWYKEQKTDANKIITAEGTDKYSPIIDKSEKYFVEGENSFGCFGSAVFTVKAKEYPIVEAEGTTSCKGSPSTVKVKESGNADYYTWIWTNNGKPDSVNGSSYSEILTETRIYQLTGTKDGCTTAPINVTAKVNELPTLSISSKQNIGESPITMCFNDIDTLIVTGADDYTWSNNSGLTQNNERSNEAEIIPTSVGEHIYKVTGKDQNNCTNTQEVKVKVNPLPIVKISATPLICENEKTDLKAEGANTYEWNWTENNNEKKASTEKVITPLTNTTIFKVVGTDENGCKSLPAQQVITVKESPSLSWSPDTLNICDGENATLTINGATSIEWEDGTKTGSTRTFYNLGTKDAVNGLIKYNFTAMNNGCTKDTTIVIKVNSLPQIDFETTSGRVKNGVRIVCVNEEFKLKAIANNCNFVWNTTENEETITKKHQNIGSVNYIVTATDKTTKCSNKNSYTVNVVENPVIKINNEIAGEVSVCNDSVISLTASGLNNNEYTWYEVNETEKTQIAATISKYETTITTKKKYLVEGVDNNECPGSATFNVLVKENPTFDFDIKDICAGENAVVSLTNRSNNTQFAWEWDNGNGSIENATSVNHKLNENRKYTVTATKDNCKTTKSAEVIVNQLPAFSIDGEKSICSKEEIYLTAKTSDNTKYNFAWTSNNGDTLSKVESVKKNLTSSTIYKVNVTDKNTKCSKSENVNITVNPLPLLQIQQENAACIGNTVELSASGADNSYVWLNKDKEETKEKNSSISIPITEKSANDTIVYLVGTNTTNCKDTISYQLKKLGKPVITISGINERCEGDGEKTIVLSGASKYTWTSENNHVGNTFTEALTADKKYSVSIESGVCKADTSFSVKVNKLPNVYITAENGINKNDTTICLNDEIQLVAHATNSTFTWNTQNSSETIPAKANTLISQKYNVIATDKTTKCSNKAEYVVNVNPLPNVQIESKELAYCKDISIDLKANNDYSSYNWSVNGVNIGTENTINYKLSNNTKFKLEVIDENKCKNYDTIEIVAKDYPVIAVNAPAVCYDKYPTLTVNKTESTADYYVWTDGTSNNSSWTASTPIKEATTYKITAYKDGCLQTKDIVVNILALPQISFMINDKASTGNFEICANDNNIKIEAKTNQNDNSKISYVWAHGTNTSTINVTPTEKTNYTVTVTDGNGCINNATQTIIVNEPSIVSIEGVKEICQGSDFTLTASGANSYQWKVDPNKDEKVNIDNNKLTYTNIQENVRFSVIGTDVNSCKSEEVYHDVKMIALPTITIVPNASQRNVCKGSNLSLTATAGANVAIQWDGAEVGYLDYIFNNNTAGEKEIKVFATTTEGCKNDSVVKIMVNELPTFTVEGKDFCIGSTTELKANGNNINFSWVGFTQNVNPVNVSKKGTYKVTGVDLNGCSRMDSIVVNAYSNPEFIISQDGLSWNDDNTACKDSTITLLATGGNYTYDWYTKNGETLTEYKKSNNKITPTVTKDIIFTAIATLKHNENLQCQSQKDYPITIKEAPEFDLEAPTVCSGNTSRIEVKNGVAGTTYNWSWENGNQAGGTYYEEKLTANREYTVIGTKDHCSYKVTKTAEVYALPKMSEITTNPANKNEVCVNDKITLIGNAISANTPISYSWKANKDLNSITSKTEAQTGIEPTLIGERTYTLTAKDEKGCINTISKNIIVNPLPIVNVIGATEICKGTNANLSIEGDYQVIWYEYDKENKTIVGDKLFDSKNETTKNFTPTINNAQSFYVEVIDEKGCKNSKVVDITLKPLPNIKFIGETTICEGGKTTISISGNSGGKNYFYNDETKEYETTSVTSKELSPNVTSTYKVKIVTSNNCEIDTTIKITVNKLPIITINGGKDGNAKICVGSSIELRGEAQSDCSFTWNNKQNTSTIEVMPLQTTQYYVVGTDNTTGCRDTAKYEVETILLPVIKIAGNTVVCQDSVVELKITNAIADYNYDWGNDNFGDSYSPIITKDSVISVTATDNTKQKCKATETYKVKVKENPTITLSSNNPFVCKGDYVNIDVTSNLPSSTYRWENTTYENKTSSLKEKVENNKTYKIYVTKDGCTSSKDINVTVWNLPTVVAELTNDKRGDTICINTAAELNATANGGTAPYSYEWTSNVISGTNKGENIQTENLTNTNTPYSIVVEVTDKNQCKGTDTIDVKVKANPVVRISGDKFVCEGQTGTLTAIGAGNEGTYVWSTKETENEITPVVKSDTTFTVEGTDIYGCVGKSNPYTIAKKNLPKLTIYGATTICEGASTKISLSGSGANSENYVWTEGENKIHGSNRTLSPTTTTTYNISGTLNGCTSDTTFTITVNKLPIINISGTKDICMNEKTTLKVNVSDSEQYSYLWNTNSQENNIEVAPTTTTLYKVQVWNENTQCSQTDSFNVIVNPLPLFELVAEDAVCMNTNSTISLLTTNGAPLADQYEWTKGNTTITPTDNSYTEKLDSDASYSVTATISKTNCKYTQSKTVEVKEVPKFGISAPTEICYGNNVSINLTENSKAHDYLWPDGRTINMGQWTEDAIKNTGIYDYKVKAINRYPLTNKALECTAEDSVKITINPVPNIKIIGPAIVCKEEPIELTAVENSNPQQVIKEYKWEGGNTTSSNNTISITPTNNSTQYTINATNNFNCSNKATYNLNAFDRPSFNFEGEREYCRGTEALISVSGNNIESITWSAVKTKSREVVVLSIVEDENSVKFNVNDSTTLTATVKSNDGCNSTDTILIKPKNYPTIDAIYDDEICKGGNVTINAKGATQWEWVGFNNKTSVLKVENISKDTAYTVNGTINGCTAEKRFNVTVLELPEIKLNDGKDTAICLGDVITLTASGGKSYEWMDIPGETRSEIQKMPTINTVYAVTGNDGKCINSDTITVIVNHIPTFELEYNKNVCDNDSVIITAKNSNLKYQWNKNSGADTQLRYKIENITKDTTGSVIGIDENGCKNSVNYTISRKPNPKLELTGKNVCYNNYTTLEVKDTSEYLGYQTTFVWEDNEEKVGNIFNSETLIKDKVFKVVANKNGCIAEDSIEIKVYDLPNILINNGDEFAYTCKGDSITLNAAGSDNNNYTWDNKTNETKETYTVRPINDETIYWLEGRNSLGCSNRDDITVVITPTPEFEIQGEKAVCNGDSVLLTGSDKNLKYVWKNKKDEVISTSLNAKIKITQDTTLFITGTAYNKNGTICSKTIEYSIKRKNRPNIKANENESVCYGTELSIMIEGYSDRYEWYKENVLISTEKMCTEVITEPQTYIAKGYVDGCDTSIAIDVTVKALPLIEISGNNEICFNDTAVLNATAGLESYQWNNLTTSSAISGNSELIKITPKVNSKIEVLVSNNDGCENKDTFEVIVHTLPSFAISASENVVCENSDVELTTTSDDQLTYKWEDEAAFSSNVNKVYSMGNYPMSDTFRVTAKTIYGCIKSDSIKISTKARPQLNIAFTDSICLGKQATMTGHNNTAKYKWYDITNGKDSLLSESSSYTTDALTRNSIFRSVAISNGCEADTTFEVVIRELPTVDIENSPEITICRNSNLEIKAISENATQYKWDNNSYSTSNTYTVYPIKDTTQYRLIVKDKYGCENTDSVLVIIQNNPVFEIIGKTDTCQGDDIVLKASNESLSYIWKNNSNETLSEEIEFILNVTQDTILKITGYTNDDLKCKSTEEHIVKVNPYPVITVVKDTDVVCYGTQAYLEVKSDIDATYIWNSGETDRYIQKEITKESKFTVTATSIKGGCMSDTSFVVNKWDLPVINAENVAICYGDSAELRANSESSDVVFRWQEASTDGARFVTPTLTSQTQYKVYGTDKNSCVGEKNVIVSINPLPQFQLSSISPVCVGTETTLTASNINLNYSWDGDSYSSKTTYNKTIDKDTTFIVWGKDNNQCESMKSIKVSVKEYPVLTLRMDNDTVCYGGSKTLYVSGANNGYEWFDKSTKNFITIDNITDTYSVSVEGTTNGCTSRIDTTIKVWQLPNIAIEPSESTICYKDSVVLKGLNGVSGKYKWTHNGVTADEVVVVPNKVGENNYSVTGYSINGCKNVGEVTINVNALPIVNIEGDVYVCRDENASLIAKSNNEATFQWIDGKDIIKEGATFNPTISTEDTTFTVLATDKNSCKSTAEYTVYVKEFPVLSYRTNTGKDTVCNGSPVVIYMSGADEYVWSADNSTENTFTEVITNKKSFTVSGTTNGCTSDTTITIAIWQLPQFGIDGDPVICLNDTAKLFTYPKNNNEVLSYKWKHSGSTDSTTLETPTTTKTFYATATDINNCKSQEEFEVIVNNLPTDIKIDGAKAVCLDSTVTLTVSGSAVHYEWRNGIEGNSIEAPIVSKDSTFYVVGTNANGCKYETSYTVASIEHPVLIPNAPDSVCYGSKINISIKGAAEYWWDDNTTKNFRSVEITQDTLFVVKGTSNGCTSTDTIKIGKQNLPEIAISTEDNNNQICRYNSIDLMATGGETYVWSTKEESANINVKPLSTTEYIVRGIGKNGCQNSDTFEVIVNPLPIVNIIGEKSICEGDSVELRAESTNEFTITNYLWGNKQTEQVVKERVIDTTYYKVTLTDINGCKNSDSILVQSKPYPVITIEAPEYVCFGQSAIISAEGANSYSWGTKEDGKIDRSFADTPKKDTTYTVFGTSNGCTSEVSRTVVVKALPNVVITTADSIFAICLQDSIVLTANGAKTYTWNTGATDQSIVVTPMSNTEYKVIGTDELGCQNTGKYNISINKLPEFEIKGNDLICEGDVDTLWVESDQELTYVWNHLNSTSDTIYPVIDKNTTFEVTATNGNNCSSTKSYTVRSKPYPVLEFNHQEAICYGEKAIIVVSGAIDYEWQDGSTGNSLIDEPENNTTYTVTGTTRGCSTTASTNVKVWSLPNVTISGNKKDVCANDPITLSVSGASSYQWNTGHTESSISLVPNGTTAFNVTGRDLNGCESSDTFLVTVHPLPVISIDGPDAVCADSIATLTANGALTYLWNTNETTQSINPKISNTRTYVVIGYDEYNCKSTATKNVRKKEHPIITYTAPKSICYGTMANISVIGASQYIWQDGSTGNAYSDSPEQNTTYSVVGITENCSTSIDIPVNVLALPKISITGKNEICINKSVTLTARGASSYVWNTGLQSDKLTMIPMNTATYIVTGTDENNCKDTASYTVKVNPLPVVNIQGDSYACYESLITLTAIGDKGYTYKWNDGSTNNTFTEIVKESATYLVSATDTNGCTSIATHNVTKVDYPVLTYQAPDTICFGEFVSITASGANEYLWSTGSTTNQISDQPQNTSIYKVVGTTNGCSDSINIPVAVLSLPDITFQGDTVICEGNKLVLEAKGAETYQWNTGISNNILEAFPTKSTKYTLTGIAETGCSNTLEIPVTVHYKPQFSLIGDEEVCENSSVTLKAKGEANTYYWSTGSASHDQFITQNDVELKIPINQPTFVFVKGVDEHGCENTTQKSIKTLAPPTLEYEGETEVCNGDSIKLHARGASTFVWKRNGQYHEDASYTFIPNEKDIVTLIGYYGKCSREMVLETRRKPSPEMKIIVEDTIACKNDEIKLTAEGANIVEWKETGETTKVIHPTITHTKKFTVTGTAPNGCKSTTTKTIVAKNLPKIKANHSKRGCPEIGTIVSLTATGASDLKWTSLPINDEIEGVTVSPSEVVEATIYDTTKFIVIGTDEFKCQGTDTITVIPKTFEEIKFDITPQVIDEDNRIVAFLGISPATEIWKWETGDQYVEEIEGKDVNFTYRSVQDSFEVKVTALDKDGCVHRGSSFVYVWKDIWIADAFTPNGDGLNDDIGFVSENYVSDLEFRIYDRLGTVVFEGKKGNRWDGTHKGNPCQWGVYGYVVKYRIDYKGIKKDNERRGHITLIR